MDDTVVSCGLYRPVLSEHGVDDDHRPSVCMVVDRRLIILLVLCRPGPVQSALVGMCGFQYRVGTHPAHDRCQHDPASTDQLVGSIRASVPIHPHTRNFYPAGGGFDLPT